MYRVAIYRENYDKPDKPDELLVVMEKPVFDKVFYDDVIRTLFDLACAGHENRNLCADIHVGLDVKYRIYANSFVKVRPGQEIICAVRLLRLPGNVDFVTLPVRYMHIAE